MIETVHVSVPTNFATGEGPGAGLRVRTVRGGHRFATGADTGFPPLEAGTLEVSPVEDNVRQPEAVTAALKSVAPADDLKKRTGSKKRRRAALILPDYAARVNVLDFDSFPAAPEEQLAWFAFA